MENVCCLPSSSSHDQLMVPVHTLKCLVPPNPLMVLLHLTISPWKSSLLWEIHLEHLLSMPTKVESVVSFIWFLDGTCGSCCCNSASRVRARRLSCKLPGPRPGGQSDRRSSRSTANIDAQRKLLRTIQSSPQNGRMQWRSIGCVVLGNGGIIGIRHHAFSDPSSLCRPISFTR